MAKIEHVVCYSGGHSSALVAIEVVRKFGPDGVVLLNHDINPRVEHEDVKRFKREVSDYLGVGVTYANHKRVDEWDQFDVCEDAGAFQVSLSSVICTSRLKTQPFQRWLKENAPPGSCVVYYGFDQGERSRIQRRSSILSDMGYRSDYPLALWPDEARTIRHTSEVGIDPPLTYGVFKHANCMGCIKAGKQHWYAVFVQSPETWERAKMAEERIGHSIMKSDYLEELEPTFSRMRDAGICPTEHVDPRTWWASVKRKLDNQLSLDLSGSENERPCECVI